MNTPLLQIYNGKQTDPERAWQRRIGQPNHGLFLRRDSLTQKEQTALLAAGAWMVAGQEVPLTRSADGVWLLNDQSADALTAAGGLWSRSDRRGMALVSPGSTDYELVCLGRMSDALYLGRKVRRHGGHIHSSFLSKLLTADEYTKNGRLMWGLVFGPLLKSHWTLWCNGVRLDPSKPVPLTTLF